MRGKQVGPRPTPFGRWLTEERLARELTQRALAERAGISDSRIAQLETGAQPTRHMIRELSAGLAPAGAGDDTRAAILSAGMTAAGFGPSHELDSLPDPVRAVLTSRMDALRALDAEKVRRLAEVIGRVIDLAGE